MREKRGIIVWGLNFAFGVGIREGGREMQLVGWFLLLFPYFKSFLPLQLLKNELKIF